jgi:hypothetical protein
MRSFLGRTRRTAPRSVLHGIGSLIQSSDVPSLDLNFLYGYLDPRIDFQRTTTGTYYRGPFNQNLVTYSQQFSVSLPWGTNSGGGGSASSPVVATTTEPAPDGTLTAFRVTFNKTGGTFSRLEHPLSVGVIGQTYTMSVWMKANTANGAAATQNVGIRIGNDPSGYNCVVTTSWQRFSYSYTVAATATNAQIMLWDSIVGNDETADVFIWGAQLTEGSLLTPYLPTTTAAITQGQIAAAEPWNLFVRSEEFNTTWAVAATGAGSNPVVTANAAVAPDGTTTADQIDFNCGGLTSSDRCIIRQTLTGFTSGSTVTLSVWLKSATGNTQYVQFHENGGTGPTTYAIGPDWQRISYSYAITAGTTGLELRGNNSQAVTTSSVYAWGAQVNQGSAPLAYRSTTTAALWLPRFENDPITGAARGLLIEGGATNLQLYSADITNGAARTNITIGATKITAPDGTTSGELVSATTTGATSLRGSTHTIAGTNATGSIFIKQASLAVVQFWIIDSTTSTTILSGTYTFATKATAIASGTGTMTATDAGNGWVRIALSVTTFVSGNNLRFFYGFNGNTATAGDSFYLWGVQIEQQPFASSYIPTTTATVARGTDSALMTGTNFSSWFNQAEGTIYAETLVTSTSGGGQLAASMYQNSSTYLDIGQGTATSAAGTTRFYIRTGGVDEAVLDRTLSPLTLYASARMAGAYRTNDAAYTLNGLSVVTDATVTLPSAPIELRLGQQQTVTTSSRLIRRFAYWPTRLPNATLQALTT